MRLHPFLFFSGFMLAILLISSAGAVSPEAEAQWKIAKDLYAGGKCVAALVASEKAISLDPQFGRPWNVKGAALHCLGRNTEALEAFATAFRLDPYLTIAQKNIDHVQLDIKNGASLTSPVIVLPVHRNSSIISDGELGYAPIGEPTGCWAFSKDGHAVKITNQGEILVTGVRLAGCKYGTGNGKVRIEIWDQNFTPLSSDTIPYDQVPFTVVREEPACLGNASWVDVDIPDHEVFGDFYIVLFTDSAMFSQRKEAGMSLVYYTPSETGTSYAMTTNPNRPEVQKIGRVEYLPEELDWAIRVLFSEVHSSTVSPGEPQAPEMKTEASPSMSDSAPESNPTSIPLGVGSILGALSVVVGFSFRKK